MACLRSLYPLLAVLFYVLATVYLETDIDAKGESLASQWSVKYNFLYDLDGSADWLISRKRDPPNTAHVKSRSIVKMRKYFGFSALKRQEKQKKKYMQSRKSEHAKSSSSTALHKKATKYYPQSVATFTNREVLQKDTSRVSSLTPEHPDRSKRSNETMQASVEEFVPTLPPTEDPAKNGTLAEDASNQHEATEEVKPEEKLEEKVEEKVEEKSEETLEATSAPTTLSKTKRKATRKSRAGTRPRSLWKHAPQFLHHAKSAKKPAKKPVRAEADHAEATTRALGNFTFTSPAWRDEFDAALAALAARPRLAPEAVRQLQGWAFPAGLTRSSAGRSAAQLTATHALLANACVDAEGVRVFEAQAGQLRQAAARFNGANSTDFYCASGRRA